MAKTSQATRNVRKFIKRQATGIKGRMVTDDYGNRYSVKANPNGGVARRHTLSRGKERAHTLLGDKKESKSFHENLKKSAKYDKKGSTRRITRHTLSARRRANLREGILVKPKITLKTASKENYHDVRSRGELKTASYAASNIHYGKRKHKDFTK